MNVLMPFSNDPQRHPPYSPSGRAHVFLHDHGLSLEEGADFALGKISRETTELSLGHNTLRSRGVIHLFRRLTKLRTEWAETRWQPYSIPTANATSNKGKERDEVVVIHRPAKFVELWGLQKITLNSNHVGGDALEAIAEFLEGDHKLRELYLAHNDFGSTLHMEKFARAVSRSGLQVLSLNDTGINNDLLDTFLSSLSSTPTLTSSSKPIPILPAHPLTDLHLSLNPLNYTSTYTLATFLASSIKVANLQLLALNGCDLGWQSILVLSKIIEFWNFTISVVQLDSNHTTTPSGFGRAILPGQTEFSPVIGSKADVRLGLAEMLNIEREVMYGWIRKESSFEPLQGEEEEKERISGNRRPPGDHTSKEILLEVIPYLPAWMKEGKSVSPKSISPRGSPTTSPSTSPPLSSGSRFLSLRSSLPSTSVADIFNTNNNGDPSSSVPGYIWESQASRENTLTILGRQIMTASIGRIMNSMQRNKALKRDVQKTALDLIATTRLIMCAVRERNEVEVGKGVIMALSAPSSRGDTGLNSSNSAPQRSSLFPKLEAMHSFLSSHGDDTPTSSSPSPPETPMEYISPFRLLDLPIELLPRILYHCQLFSTILSKSQYQKILEYGRDPETLQSEITANRSNYNNRDSSRSPTRRGSEPNFRAMRTGYGSADPPFRPGPGHYGRSNWEFTITSALGRLPGGKGIDGRGRSIDGKIVGIGPEERELIRGILEKVGCDAWDASW